MGQAIGRHRKRQDCLRQRERDIRIDSGNGRGRDKQMHVEKVDR